MFPMPEKRIFPMKNLLHYGSWLITAGVEGSEPTNLVFCRYFERPTQFFYQSSKEWAQGGAADHLHDRELGGCENPATLLSWQFVYFYWETNELLISCVWRSGWCEQDVFASTWQSDWEWVSDQIVIRPRLGYIWVNTHSSPPQHCWHCEIWLRDSYVTRTSLNFWTLNWKLGQRLNIWRDIIRKL